MAGGNFNIGVSKTRPGTYVNFVADKLNTPSGATRGIAIIPLVNLGWGPDKEFLHIMASKPDEYVDKLGHSVYDNHSLMVMIREVLKNAYECVVYVINKGTKATKTTGDLVITATYGGSRGNNISVVCIANPVNGFDVRVYLDNAMVEEYEGVKTIGDLIAASSKKYVVFSAADTTENLVAFASVQLATGTDGEASNSDVSGFLDASENVKWNTMAFPLDDTSLHAAAIAKIKYLRESVGKMVQCVIADCGANSEGIINVTNSVQLEDGALTEEQACAWVAGVTAAAGKTVSNTYVVYVGATAVIGVKTNEEANAAINAGEFFFSPTDSGEVVVEYDINSLHTFTEDKTQDYCKNRVIRVYDSFADDLKLTFPPNKYANSEEGWLIMEGIGRSLLLRYADEGAISDVDADNDFCVDKSKSIGDETYFNVGIKAVDSAEKLYFSVATR